MNGLEGIVAVVTGASRGIGAEIAKILGEYGAHVIASSRGGARCRPLVETIIKEGGSAEVQTCHIGKLDQIEALFETIDQVHGRVDILVNNAAANPYYGHILDTPVLAFEKTVEINLRGYFFMSAAAGRRMKRQGDGSIVNVASAGGVSPGDVGVLEFVSILWSRG